MVKTEKQHTDLSPSNADRWMHCPGSVALCQRMPKPAPSKHADEGTAAHTLLERCLKNQKINPYDLVGEMIGDFEVTDEMAESISFAREIVQQELQKGGVLHTETRVTIAPEIMGTIDIAIVREFAEIVIYDFKYGKGVPVSAVDNPQLLMYLLGMSKKFEAMKFKIGIIQPRIDTAMISTWEVTAEYLTTFEQEVSRCLANTKDPNALVLQGKWCRWCWAKAVCPEMHQQVVNMFPDVQSKPRELRLPDVRTLTPQRIAEILDIAEGIKDWFSAVAGYAAEYIDIGGTIPNYDLVKKRANRQWRDEAEALEAFSDLGEKAFKVKILSPAQMEKLAGKDRVAEYTVVPDTGTTLKRIGEKENDTAKQIN